MGDQTLRARVEHDFTLHPPKGDAIGLEMDRVRDGFKALALAVVETCPPGREQSLALSKLEEGLFWAIAALARNQP